MANLTLLPEEDPPNPPKRHDGIPPIVCSGDRLRDMASLLVRFSPQLIGFGIVGQRLFDSFEASGFDLSPHAEPATSEKPAEEQK